MYIETAKTVKNNLERPIKNNVKGAIGVKVDGFSSGSVVAQYTVVINESVSVNASEVKKGISNAIATGNFSLPVDKSYSFNVTGKCVYLLL